VTPAFTGWPRDALAFLRELEANNDREWFHERRERYEASLAEPGRLLGAALSDLGRPKLFRPFNDTRFRPGPPIKEHVGLAIGYEGAGGWYVELSLDGVFVACGLHNPQPDQVERLRRAVDGGRTAAALTKALRVGAAGGLSLNPPDLKRVPRGYAPDHPRAELLQRRRIVLTRRERAGAWLSRPECGERIRALLEAGAPTVRWLRTHVGPSDRVPRGAGQR
jgi:uncharacterized protein (TIGR02453 family)